MHLDMNHKNLKKKIDNTGQIFFSSQLNATDAIRRRWSTTFSQVMQIQMKHKNMTKYTISITNMRIPAEAKYLPSQLNASEPMRRL
jgi:hypothetical protein